MKRCFKCGTEKPLEDFYRHSEMKDGRLGKCKECTKTDMRIDRLTKPRVREYDRQRANQPHRKALRSRVSGQWAKAHPDRRRAQGELARALKSGAIKKPSRCALCHLPSARLEGHHPDYAHPLAVIWVCKPCHATADKLRRLVSGMISQLPF